VVEDPALSRIHAEILYDGSSLMCKDNGSLNGSYINNVRITTQVLSPGDEIRLGDTTLKVIEEDPSQEICWQEHAPFVTSAISLDHLTEQTKEAASRARGRKGRRQEKSEGKKSTSQKLITNLETIYEVGKNLNSIRNLDEMLEQVGNTALEVFQGVERLCVLLRGKNGDSRFEPKIIKTES